MVKKNADFNGTFNGTTPNLREFRHPVELQSVLVDLFWSVGMNIVLSAWSHNANYGLYLWLEPSLRGTMDPDDQKGAEREGVGAGGGCGEGGGGVVVEGGYTQQFFIRFLVLVVKN